MGRKIISFLKYSIFLGGGLFLVWWQLHTMTPQQFSDFKNALARANYVLIIPVIIMNLLSHLSRSMRWKLLMEPLGYHPKLKNVFAVTMIGYLANGAVNRLGEVLKCTFLSRYEKLKADKLIGTILIERTFDLICYLVFIGITLLIQLDALGGFAARHLHKLAHGGRFPFWAKASIFIVFVFMVIAITRKIFAKYTENKIVLRVKDFFYGIGHGFSAIKSLRNRKLFLAHTFFIWAMYLLQIYLAFKALDSTAHLGIRAAFTVLSLSTLAMILTPGGIGSFPIFVMKTLLIYGIASTQGSALGWIIWGVSTGIIVIAGVISLVLLPYLNKKPNEVDTGNSGQNISVG